MIKGSCLCGTVHWEIEPPLERLTHCHCSMCRKTHGAAFGTYATVPRERFALTAGADALRRYGSSPALERSFCSVCGSVGPIEETGTQGSLVSVPAGCFDDDPGARPDAHIYMASQAPWHLVGDDGNHQHLAAGLGSDRSGLDPVVIAQGIVDRLAVGR